MCGDHQCLNGHISGTHMEKEKKKTKKKPTFFALSTYLDQLHHHSPFFICYLCGNSNPNSSSIA